MNISTHNPDVITCIANLSNDEVFTPPDLAKAVLDQLENAWSLDNNGESIWSNPDVTFLDPFTKTGVFLREITFRLVDGLASQFPDLQERVDHILTNQVYGIAITELTGLLARRTVYCSKWANSKHSICTKFDDPSGNIWFERTEHTWKGSKPKCTFCGVAKKAYERSGDQETHAYALIHSKNIKKRINEIFGAKMHFDVIIGNPPYQLGANGGTRDKPIYQLFLQQAKSLEPRYLTMIIPSRWMSTGLGLQNFRKEMLEDKNISDIVDYPAAAEVFSGVEVKGGVCYFLRKDVPSEGCNFTSVRAGVVDGPVRRDLNEFDILVRENRALGILRKVLSKNEESIQAILSVDKQFGWTSNYSGLSETKTEDSIPVYCYQDKRRQVKYIDKNQVTKSPHLLPYWKVLSPKAASDGGKTLPNSVLGKPWVAESGSACTQSFLFFWVNTREEAESLSSYYRTRFFRFLVSLRKFTQDATHNTYKWVPIQSWDQTWTDEALYSKYGLTDEEIAIIEEMVKPMGDD